MRPKSWIGFGLGLLLLLFGFLILMVYKSMGGLVPLLIGGALCYVGFSKNRIATLVFGHTCIVVGCFLVTWGLYLLPVSKPIFSHIIGRPLFWGLFSIFGGVCANYHGFCNCIRRSN